jgi:hypothetical protein
MTVAIGGSRHLTNQKALVRHVLQCIQARGWRVATGCAPGIDATVRRLALEMGFGDDLTVFAVGSWDGQGWEHDRRTWEELRDLGEAGSDRVYWAQGGYGPLRERLRNRTLAMVRAERVGWVIGITAPDSIGTRLLLEEAKRLEKRMTEYAIPPHQQSPPRGCDAP